MIKLTYVLFDGRQFSKLINPKLIAEIEEDTRHDKSHSIVKTIAGEKLFCVESMDELLNQMNKGE